MGKRTKRNATTTTTTSAKQKRMAIDACVESMGMVPDTIEREKISRSMTIRDAYDRERVVTYKFDPNARYPYQIRCGFPDVSIPITEYANRETIFAPVILLCYSMFNVGPNDPRIVAMVNAFVAMGIPETK